MGKIISIYVLLSICLAKNVWSNATDDLKNRLSKINSFHANFRQKIIDNNGNVIQESQGNLWVKRPNFFSWHVSRPNEKILISNGETLWLYSPSIEQVTIVCIKDVISNDTPFMLITNDKLNDLENYKIEKKDDNFTLIPKNSRDTSFKKFTINVSCRGIIHQFNVDEQDNYSNSYELELLKNSADEINTTKFMSNFPKRVTIDDQRN